ncbi:hypothetical protein K7432_007837 [Basidiobolus ranarum]|uniref:Uncharacterized protein n=1 Tax=Basidiobolus ranarum TaxID=34480 RepID=A0ABR2WSS3_9FUNG
MIRRIQSMKLELEVVDRAIGKGKAKAPPEHEDPYVLIEREIADIISSIHEVSLKIDDLKSLEANNALCSELALDDQEFLPNTPTFSATLEEPEFEECRIELDEFQDPIELNHKRQLLTEDSDSSDSPEKKTKIWP